jgi:hypothetical protein
LREFWWRISAIAIPRIQREINMNVGRKLNLKISCVLYIFSPMNRAFDSWGKAINRSLCICQSFQNSSEGIQHYLSALRIKLIFWPDIKYQQIYLFEMNRYVKGRSQGRCRWDPPELFEWVRIIGISLISFQFALNFRTDINIQPFSLFPWWPYACESQ